MWKTVLLAAADQRSSAHAESCRERVGIQRLARVVNAVRHERHGAWLQLGRDGGEHFLRSRRLRGTCHCGEERGPRVRLAAEQKLVHTGSRECQDFLGVRVARGAEADHRHTPEQMAKA